MVVVLDEEQEEQEDKEDVIENLDGVNYPI